MAVAYDIKAIPTVYGARQFRSRLEAKWASFFSLCGWQFEYEPFDLGTWSPDFLLLGKTNVLVEVKPITDIDEDVTAKMISAARSTKWDGDLLLVGVSPKFDMDHGPFFSPAIGWLGERHIENEWASAPGSVAFGDEFVRTPEETHVICWDFGRASTCGTTHEDIDFTRDNYSYTGRMRGGHYKENNWQDNSDWLKRVWDKAANRVQWHKR